MIKQGDLFSGEESWDFSAFTESRGGNSMQARRAAEG